MTIPSIQFKCNKCGKVEYHISTEPNKYCYCSLTDKVIKANGKKQVISNGNRMNIVK